MKSNLRTFVTVLSLASLFLVSLVLVPKAQAVLVTYTNQADWEAALSGTASLEDFEGQTSDTLFNANSFFQNGIALSPNQDLLLRSNARGHFTTSIDVLPFSGPAGAGINGNVIVNMRDLDVYATGLREWVSVSLPLGISAFAFEYNNYDAQGDGTSLSYIGANGSAPVVVPEFDSVDGFFGVVITGGATFQSFTFTADTAAGSNAFNSFDDVRYGVAAIPEPAAAWILGCVAVGLRSLRRKRS